jgi:hypothetical protein
MLSDLEHRLKRRFPSTTLRGNGAAKFIFVQEVGRAVEASVHNASIWIEFWNDVDESPVAESTFQDVIGAEEAIINWLEDESEPA